MQRIIPHVSTAARLQVLAQCRSMAVISSRAFTTSRPTSGIEEFFPVPIPEGQTQQKSGRAWTAAELRNKDFSDLHKLWFVCLKERNMLLSERLYYRQIGQAAPDPHRLSKVRKTMAMIKVVINERARATQLMKQDQLLKQEAEEKARKIVDLFSNLEKTLSNEVPISNLNVSDDSVLEAAKDKEEAISDVKSRLKNVTVTYKKFGRTYTVPIDQAPEKPTRQQKKVMAKTRKYFNKARAMTEAPPTLPSKSSAFVYATTGVKTN